MDFQELLVIIAKILDGFNVPYAVTGGYAVSIWGRLRATFDLDIIVNLFPSKIKQVRSALEKISAAAYIDKDAMSEAVEHGKEFNFIHPESGIKVDFFVQGKNLFSTQELNRRVPVRILDYKVYFVSPEDLILAKLRWHKTSPSERQLEDVESVIKIQKKLDWKYLKKWAAIQSTTKTLEKLLLERSF